MNCDTTIQKETYQSFCQNCNDEAQNWILYRNHMMCKLGNIYQFRMCCCRIMHGLRVDAQ